MLGDTDAFATIAVRDGQKAKAFYRDKLGLALVEEGPGASTYSSGGSRLLVYESQYAGTNKATAATWAVKDIDETVRDLKRKGVSFEHYDNLPGLTVEGDVHVGGDMRVAWLKDPDGNILSLYGAH